MGFLKKLNLKPEKILKVSIFVFIGVVILGVVLSMTGTSMNGMVWRGAGMMAPIAMGNAPYFNVAQEFGNDAGGVSDSYGGGGTTGYATKSSTGVMGMMSLPSIPPIYPTYGISTGNTAENFEVTNYTATIETRTLTNTCMSVADLKSKVYVIFENANSYEHGCSFTFKVEKARAPEILAIIKSLDPKDLSENTSSIKKMLDNFSNRADIYEKKKASIDETLKNAIASYNEIASVATKAKDAQTLAKIIDSKILLIERLTQERVNINTVLDELDREKADQLDQIAYTNFYVTVYENKYVDFKNLKDSWKEAVKQFVQNINLILQNITVNMLSFVFSILQYVLYLFILVIVAKYGWQLIKHIWKR